MGKRKLAQAFFRGSAPAARRHGVVRLGGAGAIGAAGEENADSTGSGPPRGEGGPVRVRDTLAALRVRGRPPLETEPSFASIGHGRP